MQSEIVRFRRESATENQDRARPRYSSELRELAVLIFHRLRSEGQSQQSIAEQLGVNVNSLRSWLEVSTRSPVSNALVAVEMIDEPAPCRFTVHGPRGLRLEDARVEDVASLWKALTCL